MFFEVRVSFVSCAAVGAAVRLLSAFVRVLALEKKKNVENNED